MKTGTELAKLDATALAELIRRKALQPLELVETTIAHIECINPELNAVVTPLYEQALEAARQPLPPGPFAGVPFLLKDGLGSCAGVRETSGSRLLGERIADHDNELVLRYRRAGLIFLGKTNMPEFGLQPTTEPELFGATRNPWNPGLTPGGSSGGAAAAVAAGLVPMAHANDGGGSIRIPASCCGVFGLKPTRARIPLGPDFGDIMSGLVVQHAVTRSVRDSALLLDATAGPETGDPYWAPPPRRSFVEETKADPGWLRIVFSRCIPDGPEVHADCVAAVEDAARLCESLGHTVEEAEAPFDYHATSHLFADIWAAGCANALELIARESGQRPSPEQVEPLTWALYERGSQLSAPDYLVRMNAVQRLARHVVRVLDDYDLWLTPTLAEPPPPLGTFVASPDDPMKGFHRAGVFTPFTPICNVTGQPAMSIPLYWNRDGLPIGAHFVGRFGDEATLFRLAAQLEQARPWMGRWPSLSVMERGDSQH